MFHVWNASLRCADWRPNRKETMLAALDMIRRTYGSVEGYMVDECRLPPDTVDRIRKNLTVEAGAEALQVPVDWETNAKMVG